MDIANIIWFLVPNAQFTMSGNEYEDIEWTDERTQPTLEEVKSALPAYKESINSVLQENITARESALEKLTELGLTKQEILAIVRGV